MSFQIALTGLNAATEQLGVTSNNIANANTTGFKSSRMEFADIFNGDAAGSGSGVQIDTVRQTFSQGAVEFTGRQLDLSISGDGFFIVDDDGSPVYSRAGSFGVDGNGYVRNSEGSRLQVYPPGANNSFSIGVLADLRLTSELSAPVATSDIQMGINLPSDGTPPSVTPFDSTNTNSFNHTTSTVVYDSLGTARTATNYFVKTGAGWDVHLEIDGTFVGTQAIQFGTDGRVSVPATNTFTMPAYNPPNGANPMVIDFDLTETSQFGSGFVINNLQPDGSAAGRLRGIDIDENGVVFARFSNGQSNPLGKIALATFPNNEGLQKVTNLAFAETFDSGVPLRGEANTGAFGAITAGALESSNVDLTKELVKMITAQRFFQANTEVISTMDQVTQAVINAR
ncbi:MAG: flagellar hook protein FlgE [Gammaproteobacteria bacterium]|jgi:flagellar hook protein FlgE